MSSSSTRNVKARKDNPRNPKFSKRGRSTYQGQKRRRRSRSKTVIVRQGGQWIGVRIINQLAGGAVKFILFPVVFAKHKVQRRKK